MKSTIRYEHIAHFRTSHEIHGTEKEILIALHGYGQLAEFFLKKFEPLFNERQVNSSSGSNKLFLSPRFYGKSWCQLDDKT
jgi:hypothetical protein